MVKNTFNKSATRSQRPSGLYVATVTRVEDPDVYVEVPRLTLDFEHGPIPYVGSLPEVGDEVFVGFLEGSQDDVVAIFPGAASGGGGAGPIEVSYLVAASDARPEIRAVADFVCNGTADEVEINAPFIAAKAAGLACKVQLSAGEFHVDDGIVVDASGSWLEGAGIGVTIVYYDNNFPADTPVVDVVDPLGKASNFTVNNESECNQD